ncbi:hypothetical protein ACHAXS_005826 [Conticribra weissflogii]
MKNAGLVLALAAATQSAATTAAVASSSDTTSEAESTAADAALWSSSGHYTRKKSVFQSAAAFRRKLGKSSKSSISSSSSDVEEGWYYYGDGGHYDGWNAPPSTATAPWDSGWGNGWNGGWSNSWNHPSLTTSTTSSSSSSSSPSSSSGKSGKSSKSSKSSKSYTGKSGKCSKPSSNCEEDALIPIHTTIDFLLIQDHFHTSPKDIHQFTNVVYQFLLDNVGSEDTFFVDIVRVVDEGRGDNGNSGDVESISFRADIDFLAAKSFYEWVENEEPGEFQDDDALYYYDDEDFRDYEYDDHGYGYNEVGKVGKMKNHHHSHHHGDRRLQTGQCSGASKVACCANNSINNGKPSRDCRQKGCTLQRCGGGRRRTGGRMLRNNDSGHHHTSRNFFHNNNNSNHELPDLFEVDFTKAIRRYTSNFRPAEATSVLDAEDIDAVAICGAYRYGFENEGDSFPCRVYKKEECRDNEDLIFDKKEEVCDASQGKWDNDGHDD